MGTRGLKIVVYRGRHFVYYNSLNSFPCIWGIQLVEEIPSDPEKYKTWLSQQRCRYSSKLTLLEKAYLSVSEKKMVKFIENKSDDYEDEAVSDVLSDLDEFPSVFCESGTDVMIEWVYTIDLDNELFGVAHKSNSLQFALKDIPGDFEFLFEHPCDSDNETDEATWPAAGSPYLVFPERERYFGDGSTGELGRYRAKFHEYRRTLVRPRTDGDTIGKPTLSQVLGLMSFRKLTDNENYSIGRRDWDMPPRTRLWEKASGWKYESFAFREMSFAILSLAAGVFYFDNPDRLHSVSYTSHLANAFYIDKADKKHPKLMPAFGHGAHAPDQESGSSPKGSIYWLEGVLVSLVPDSAFEDVRDAAIAKAVEHGLADGKTRFQAILFSIQRFIMLDVCSQNGVKEVSHTKPIALVRMGWNDSNEWMPQSLLETLSAQHFDRLSQSTLERARSEAGKEDVSPVLHLRRQEAEFAALQTFFETAANRALETTSRGRLPPELYANVISKADGATHRACAKVSSITRDLSKSTFPFSPHLMVTNFQESSIPVTTDSGSTSRTRLPYMDAMGTFTFWDQSTGQTLRAAFDDGYLELMRLNVALSKGFCRSASGRQENDERRKKISTWYLVVGSPERPSLMTQFPIRLVLKPE